MRRLPIDISSMSFTVAEEPRPAVDFETKVRKTNENGELLSSLNVLVTSPSEISIIPVKVPSVPDGLQLNDPVKLVGLSATAWVNGTRASFAFSAERIEPIAKAKAAA